MLTADGGGAVGTLLSKQVAETVKAVGKVIPGRETLSSQLLFTSNTHKALLMPRLVSVVYPSCGDGLRSRADYQLSPMFEQALKRLLHRSLIAFKDKMHSWLSSDKHVV